MRIQLNTIKNTVANVQPQIQANLNTLRKASEDAMVLKFAIEEEQTESLFPEISDLLHQLAIQHVSIKVP